MYMTLRHSHIKQSESEQSPWLIQIYFLILGNLQIAVAEMLQQGQ